MKIKKYLLRSSLPIGMSLFTFIVGLLLGIKTFAPNVSELISDDTISLNSLKGKQLLTDSTLKQDYLPLSSHFVTQSKLSYCGVASITIVLNSLLFSESVLPPFGNSYAFTQDNVLNEETEKILPSWKLFWLGMTLEQLGHLFETYPTKADIYYAESLTLEQFRNLANLALEKSSSFVVVNYDRHTFKQRGAGHISPLGAYNSAIDSYLILDVARYKYSPVWVKAETLYQAMKTNDFISGKSRGFVIVSKI